MALYLSMIAMFVPMIRGIMVFYIVTTVIGAVLWIGTIHIEYPTRLALIFVALVFGLFGQASYVSARCAWRISGS